jgi:hypothetical protein
MHRVILICSTYLIIFNILISFALMLLWVDDVFDTH